MLKGNNNTFIYKGNISRRDREKLSGHKSCVLWFTGLSSSGKSTIAHALEYRLYHLGIRSYVLDGDNVRNGLCSDLGFSMEDRSENIRRIGEMCRLFVDAGIIVLASFISPLKAQRWCVRTIVGPEDFMELYCKCSLEVCESRDLKGHYQRAKRGEIKEFTGISSPYEEPDAPALILETDKISVEESVQKVLTLLMSRGIILKENTFAIAK